MWPRRGNVHFRGNNAVTFKPLIAALVIVLCACSAEPPADVFKTPTDVGQTRKYSDSYYLPVASQDQSGFLSALEVDYVNIEIRAGKSSFQRAGSGPGEPFEIVVDMPSRHAAGWADRILSFDDLAESYVKNPNDSAAAKRLAVALAEASYCRGGRVIENSDLGTGISDPADIAKILAANGGHVLGGRIPDDITPVPVQAISKNHRNDWQMYMRCVGAVWQ